MKKIGLVDFYIDEWHSNTYLGLLSRAVEELGLDYSVTYAWAELDRFENRRSTDEWCAEKNITRVNTLEELCELSDNILILAPADPQKHLEYAKTVLRYGKATYIDKTFAQNCTEAKEIYALAEKYGTPIFSTSALRYASELDALVGAQSFVSQGGGRSLEEYIVHQIEMAVKVMGTDATEAFVLLTYTYPGVPFLWNGCEFADDAENCMFSNRDYGRRSAMDWSCAHTAVGKRRLRFVKKAHRTYHAVEALQRGAFAWADAAAPEKTVVFWRQSDTERVLVAVNTAPSAATVTLPALSDGATPLLYRGAKVTDTALRRAPYGYFVARLSK